MNRKGAVFPGALRRVVVWQRDDEEVPITIRPLRIGFQRRWVEWGLVPPEVPKRVARDSQGRIVRDERGEAVLVPDEGLAEWRRASERYHLQVAALVVAEGWADEETQLEAVPQPNESGPAFADRVLDELDRSGWSAGDVVWLCERILHVSRLLGDAVSEAGERSSPTRPAG